MTLPIIITQYGDSLSVNTFFNRGTEKLDEQEGGQLIKPLHRECNGLIYRLSTSISFDVLICQKCELRVEIPKKIKTYKDLRMFFSRYNNGTAL